MSLFEAPGGSLLVHACNAKGVWGSGIAKEFKERFPTAYKRYNQFCQNKNPLGAGQLFEDNGYFIGCLITSSGFANSLDSKDAILVHTTLALKDLMSFQEMNIYSNKFNSGLFKVPWEETEKILKVFVERYDLNWTVCDPNKENL